MESRDARRVWYARTHPFADGRLASALATPPTPAPPVVGHYWFQHGRQGLRLLLDVLAEKQARPLRVGVPAFTCQVVVSAVRAAGAIAIPVDVDPATFMLTVERLPTEPLDVLVVGHLFGMRCPGADRIAEWASTHGVKVVDDFAQYLHGAADNPFSPSPEAVAAIFSFGPDKPLSSLRGGLLTTTDAGIGEQLAARQKRLPEESDIEAVGDLRELQLMVARTAPGSEYPASLATRMKTELIEVEWLRSMVMGTLPLVRAMSPEGVAPIRLAARKIGYLQSLVIGYESLRLGRERACRLAREWLAAQPGVQVPSVSLAGYGGVRWSVRVVPGRERRRLRRLLRQMGIEAGRFNWASPPWRQSELRSCPGAVECYRDVLNVPTWGAEIWDVLDSGGA